MKNGKDIIEKKEVYSMRCRPIFLLLVAMVLTLTACQTADQPPEPPAPSQTPTLTPAPASASTPAPFRVREDDVPPGEYAPWQEGYAAFLRDQRQREGELKNWMDTAIPEQKSEDPERRDAWGESSDDYSLYDVDKDGIPELFVRYGGCEASYYTICYAFREGEIVEVGDFPSGHSCLYTWPGENGAVYVWGHMWTAYIKKLWFQDGKLAFAEDFYEELARPGEESSADKDPAFFVPGSEYVQTYQSPTHWRPGDSPAPTLPVYEYGAWPRRLETPLDDAEVRAAVGRVLWEGAPLFGVSGDGFDGDTGAVTLEEYLALEALGPDNAQPLTVSEYAWADVNGDGQTDCVLRLEKDWETWSSVDYTILSLREGTVYAYFLGSNDGFWVTPDGTVYFGEKRVSFYKNQCYTFHVFRPEEGCDLAWDVFAPKP